MALAPADFYAYSRATGVPVPEDPEERAQMAPDVIEFRRNQLQAPRQESNLLQTLGLTAAGLGLAGAGAYGLTRLLGRKVPATTRVVPSAPPGTRADVYKVTEAVIPGLKPSKVAPSRQLPSPQGESAAIPQATVDLNKFINDPEFQKHLEQQEAEEYSSTPEAQQEMRRAARNVQGVESTEKARAKNILLELRNEEAAAAIPQSTVDLDVVLQQNQANDTGIDQVTARSQVQPAQRDINVTRTGLTPRQEKMMVDFGTVGAPSTDLNAPSSGQQRAAFLAQEALAAQRSKAPTDARALQKLGPQHGLTQEEIFHRISASASDYRPGSMEPLTQLDVAALLDPTVPTAAVSDLLGTKLVVRGGRVGRNLEYEVASEGAGMTERHADVDVVGEHGSDVYAFNPRTGNFEIDTSVDLEDVNAPGSRTSDYESNAADYGDVEGPGGFVSTRGFKERTKSGTTVVPGAVNIAEGLAHGSERQERQIDRVLPARETSEGDPAAGWVYDPQRNRVVLVGTGTRLQETRTNLAGKPITVVDAATGRHRDPGSYKGRILVDDPSYDPSSGGKLPGRYQPATAEPSTNINTQPISEFKSIQERLIQDAKGNWYVDTSKTKIVGEEPLRGYVGSDPNLRDLSLDRNELTIVLNKAKDRWDATNSGKTELTALDRQSYLVDSLNSYLITQKRISLPILERNKKGKLTSEAFDFINNVMPGVKVSDVYVKPAKVNANNMPLMRKQGNKVEPLIAEGYEGMEAVPLPGHYKYSGAGAVSAQEFEGEDYEGELTYFAPRVETAPQVVRAAPGGLLSTGEKGQVLSATQSAHGPMGQLSTGESVPQQQPAATYQFIPGSPYSQRTVQRAGSSYVVTDFNPLNFLRPAGAPDTFFTKELGYKVPQQSTASNIGPELVALRREMETPRAGEGLVRVPVIDQATGQRTGFEMVPNIRIGSFARTQNPYTGQAAAAMGPASRVLSGNYQYTRSQLGYPQSSAAAAENLNYQPGTANVEAMMQQTMAQAARRAGKRRNR